jgi:hypothetical protein
MPNHTYEEIRNITLDILAGRVQTAYPPNKYEYIQWGVAQVLRQRIESKGTTGESGYGDSLNFSDADLFLEVFWNLFREGVITLGNSAIGRKDFPCCRVSNFGRRILEKQDAYFFLDVSSFEKVIRGNVPKIDDTTMIYLKEAMQAFLSGCILSSSVMLGVASEHTFNLLLETIDQNPAHQKTFSAVEKERMLLKRFNVFKKILDNKYASALPANIKEDLDTHVAAILAVIRNFRNESGHPSGKVIEREQAYVLLNLFPAYCKKVYQLREFFAT